MGCKPSVTSQNEPVKPSNIIFILCSADGFMLDVNEAFEKSLHYSLKDVKRKFIGMLMNKLISYLHKKVFIKRLASVSGLDESRLLYKLHSKTAKRPFIIYDLNGKPVYVNMNIIVHDAMELAKIYSEFKMKTPFQQLELQNNRYLMIHITETLDMAGVESLDSFSSINKYNTQSESKLFYSLSGDISTTFKQTQNDVVVICIDIIDSTQMLVAKGERHMIHISQQFYEDVIEVIKRSFYPFIYIYEIIGDCFMFIINSDWTYNISQFCAMISVYFIKKLIKKVKDYISIRAGISYGKISYGLIGGNVRLFGDNVSLSAKLEHECAKNEILISAPLYEKMKSEIVTINGYNRSSSSTAQMDSPGKGMRTPSERFDFERKETVPSDENTDALEDSQRFHIFDINKDVEHCHKHMKGLGNVDCFKIKPERISNIFSFLDEN